MQRADLAGGLGDAREQAAQLPGGAPGGSHSRLDYPAYDDYWGEHNIVVRKDVEGMRAEPRPVVKTAELAAMIEERKAAERA